jgi:3-oxoacyl-[acyl-carrier protein] reductase
VTGASRGAGAAIARALAREGAAVCVNYLRSEEQAHALVREIERSGGRAFAFRADVTDAEAVRRMVEATVERYGRLDVAVNNALPDYRFDPSAPYVRVETVEWAHFQGQIEGALRGTLNVVQAALPHFRARGGAASSTSHRTSSTTPSSPTTTTPPRRPGSSG